MVAKTVSSVHKGGRAWHARRGGTQEWVGASFSCYPGNRGSTSKSSTGYCGDFKPSLVRKTSNRIIHTRFKQKFFKSLREDRGPAVDNAFKLPVDAAGNVDLVMLHDVTRYGELKLSYCGESEGESDGI